MRTITIQKNDSGQRLDKFLQKRFKTLPETLLYKYIRKKCIRVNGIRTTAPDYELQNGDVLSLYISDEFFQEQKKVDFASLRQSFSVVYEDPHILIINKPVGLLCQSDERESRNTLVNQLQAYLIEKNEYFPEQEQSFAPALCNRIDKNTQGIVLAAKSAEALRILNQKIKDREIGKYYQCLVFGKMPQEHEILTAFLKKDAAENHVHILSGPAPGYKKIITEYRVLSYQDRISRLSVLLHTGRTHQIRAHMAYTGHPLLGDTKYGTVRQNEGYPFRYQALSSCKVRFAFQTDAGILNYLNNQEFSIKPFFDEWRP